MTVIQTIYQKFLNFIVMSEGSISPLQKYQVAEDLWDSILTDSNAVPLGEEQKQELDRRLEMHRQNPKQGSTWEEVKQRLGFSK